MKDIINETFKKHLSLLRGRLNENFEEEGDSKVDKFIKNAVMADSQMALMKNRDNLILIVKTFMEATGNKPHSDRAVEMYIDRVAGSSSGYVSRLENPDIVVPGIWMIMMRKWRHVRDWGIREGKRMILKMCRSMCME